MAGEKNPFIYFQIWGDLCFYVIWCLWNEKKIWKKLVLMVYCMLICWKAFMVLCLGSSNNTTLRQVFLLLMKPQVYNSTIWYMWHFWFANQWIKTKNNPDSYLVDQWKEKLDDSKSREIYSQKLFDKILTNLRDVGLDFKWFFVMYVLVTWLCPTPHKQVD